MEPLTVPARRGAAMLLRARALFELQLEALWKHTDRVFAWLMVFQWIGGIVIALTVSPRTWVGSSSSIHLHVWTAVLLGAIISSLPVYLALTRPGSLATRHVIAVGQMLMSAMLIHLTGGRIETHFHVFGSLSFLAFYRDLPVLISGSAVVALDHWLRGVYWPQSVYGVLVASPWRWMEHAGWVVFLDFFLILSIVRSRKEMREIAERQAQLEATKETVEHEVLTRTEELRASDERFRLAAAAVNSAIYEWDIDTGRMLGAEGLSSIFGYPPTEVVPLRAWWEERIHPEDLPRVRDRFETCLREGAESLVDYRFRDQRGKYRDVCDRGKIVRDATGRARRIVGNMEDISQRHQMELQLRQAQKLEAVGRLGAGIAHEINTPIQFVGDSVRFLRDGFTDLLELVEDYRRLRTAAAAGPCAPALIDEMCRAEERADIDYLAEQIPRAIERSLEGTSRVAEIVRAMKEFSHPDRKERSPADVNRALQTTLTVAHNELKYVADVETDFGELPPVVCHLGDLNQVFLNLLVNAAQAIGEVVGTSGDKGTITVRTRTEEDQAVIEIADTGCGIPQEIRGRVFDPFFTTKEVGHGTGQGLAIARSIVVEKHGGALTFDTQTGRGTTFQVRLPMQAAALENRVAG